MYTLWKRTVPPASLATFDAPDREKCTARRALTNTPLQALALLNDPTYVEAARALAQRALLEGGTETRQPASPTRSGLRRRGSRAARKSRCCGRFSISGSCRSERNPPSALQLLSVGESPRSPALDPVELAAWTTVTSVIFNLDETLNK